jgi:hypothetical protein
MDRRRRSAWIDDERSAWIAAGDALAFDFDPDTLATH